MAVVRAKKQGGCCLFKLFLILVVLAAILIACVIGGVYWGKNKLASMASPKPLSLTYPGATPAEVTAIKSKWSAVPTTAGAPPISYYTDKEVNTLIGNDPEFKPLKDRLFVKFAQDKATLLISLPVTLDGKVWETGTAPAGTNYLNAVATLTPSASATEPLRFRVSDLKFESKLISAANTAQVKDFINKALDDASAKMVVQNPGSYIGIEGDQLAIQRQVFTLPPATATESSDTALPPDGSAPAPETVPAPNSNSSY